MKVATKLYRLHSCLAKRRTGISTWSVAAARRGNVARSEPLAEHVPLLMRHVRTMSDAV